MKLIYDHYSNTITIMRAMAKTSLEQYLISDWKTKLLQQAEKDLNTEEFNKIKIELYWGDVQYYSMDELVKEINKIDKRKDKNE